MKKEIKRYAFFLSLLGIINVSLIVLSINAVIVMNFPEYSGIEHLWNIYGVLIPLVPLTVLNEGKGEKRGWKILLLSLAVFSVFLSKGNVARTGWGLSLSMFMIPSLFGPRPDGKPLMIKPHIWQGLVYLISYGIGQINGNQELISLEIVVIYIFFVIWVLSININGTMKRIRDEKGEVEVDSILKENRKRILLFIVLFSLLSLLLPFILENIKGERVVSDVVYEWGEEKEEENIYIERYEREKGTSGKAKALDFSPLGNLLMWTFILMVIGFLVMELYALMTRIKGIDGRKVRHKDQFDEDFTMEALMDREERTKRSFRLFPGYEEKIRSLYRKNVERRAKGEELSSLSTEEIEARILSFDNYEFSSIYEDIRYSQKKPGREDYERMKRTLGRQKKSSK